MGGLSVWVAGLSVTPNNYCKQITTKPFLNQSRIKIVLEFKMLLKPSSTLIKHVVVKIIKVWTCCGARVQNNTKLRGNADMCVCVFLD